MKTHPVARRIRQLLQLCGDDPSAAFALRHRALPLHRDEAGWIAVRQDGVLIFVDDATGRVSTELPPEWIEKAEAIARIRYPDVALVMKS
ncbi:MAG TPA: hypothetical protein VNL91_09480 [Thermoanaerobaculia bacterium]|nr:hypothetical protein [Thermoanaerobaculia bacterium]